MNRCDNSGTKQRTVVATTLCTSVGREIKTEDTPLPILWRGRTQGVKEGSMVWESPFAMRAGEMVRVKIRLEVGIGGGVTIVPGATASWGPGGVLVVGHLSGESDL